MANQQLVDYIKEQLKGGTSKENVKQVLLGVGWTNADIDEAFKIIEAESKPEVESIKVPESNLVNLKGVEQKSGMSETSSSFQTTPNVIKFDTPREEVFKIKLSQEERGASKIESSVGQSTQSQPQQIKIEVGKHPKKFRVILYVVVGLFIAGLLVLVAFLYNKNNQLTNQINANLSQRGDLENQAQTLLQTVNELQKQILSLKDENTKLNTEKENLINQLLLFSPSTSSLDVVLKGTVVLDKGNYFLKTNQDIWVKIKNSKDEKTKLVLDKFIDKEVKVEGLRTPGLRELTVVKINDKTIDELIEEGSLQTSTTTTKETSTPVSTTTPLAPESKVQLETTTSSSQ